MFKANRGKKKKLEKNRQLSHAKLTNLYEKL